MAIAIAVATLGAFFFVDQLFHFLVQPIMPFLPEPKKLIVISPIEQVVAYLKICVITGLLVAIPFVLYQLWKFVAPGLYPKEKKFVLPFVFFGTVFFVGGAAFGFYVFLPITFKFLVQVLPAEVIPQYTVERYFSLVTQMILAMGIIFELPLVLAMLSLAGIVKTAMLKKYRRYAIIIAFIVSGIVTPTVDPYTQTLMALPLIIFYEVGIWFAFFTEKRRGKSAEIIDAPE